MNRKDIDADQVRKLAALGCTHEEIADVVGCSHDTIARRFKDEVEIGRRQGNASLRRKQFDLAMSGNVTMLIWLGKQRLGQAEKSQIETIGKESITVQIGGARQDEDDAETH
jgi:AraC-like DNA-binding protein